MQESDDTYIYENAFCNTMIIIGIIIFRTRFARAGGCDYVYITKMRARDEG